MCVEHIRRDRKRRFSRPTKRIISDSAQATFERTLSNHWQWVPQKVTLNRPTWRIGVTAAWPCQESGHVDQAANHNIPTQRCGAVGIPPLQGWEEVKHGVSVYPDSERRSQRLDGLVPRRLDEIAVKPRLVTHVAVRLVVQNRRTGFDQFTVSGIHDVVGGIQKFVHRRVKQVRRFLSHVKFDRDSATDLHTYYTRPHMDTNVISTDRGVGRATTGGQCSKCRLPPTPEGVGFHLAQL